MSRLVELAPDVCQDPEPEGQEDKYYIFKELPYISTVQKVQQAANMTVNVIKKLSGESSRCVVNTIYETMHQSTVVG